MNIVPNPCNPNHEPSAGRAQCPLCGGANACQLCTGAAGPCWCLTASIPEALVARVPAELRNRACLCAACVADFHRQPSGARPLATVPGEFYFDAGRMVFSASYHLRRGYCCGSGCRHCPYPASP